MRRMLTVLMAALLVVALGAPAFGDTPRSTADRPITAMDHGWHGHGGWHGGDRDWGRRGYYRHHYGSYGYYPYHRYYYGYPYYYDGYYSRCRWAYYHDPYYFDRYCAYYGY